MSLVVRLE